MSTRHALVNVLVIVLCTRGNVNGQQEDSFGKWKASVGASYRTFGDVDFAAYDITPAPDTFLNGRVSAMGAGFYRYEVAAPVRQVDNVTLQLVEYHTAVQPAEDHRLQGAAGSTISLKRRFAQHDSSFSWSLDLSLLTAFADDSTTLRARTQATAFNIPPPGWPNANAPAPGGGPDPNTTAHIAPVRQPAQPNQQSEVAAWTDYDIDLDLYTLGAGITAEQTLNRFGLTLGVGPTLSVVSSYTSRQAQAAWSHDRAVFFRSNRSSTRDCSIIPGLYAQAGIHCQLTEDISVGVNGRYDWLAYKLDTELAEFDLAGFSATAVLRFDFR